MKKKCRVFIAVILAMALFIPGNVYAETDNSVSQEANSTQDNENAQDNSGSQDNENDQDSSDSQDNENDQDNSGSQDNESDQDNGGSQDNENDQDSSGSQDNESDQDNGGSQDNENTQDNSDNQDNENDRGDESNQDVDNEQSGGTEENDNIEKDINGEAGGDKADEDKVQVTNPSDINNIIQPEAVNKLIMPVNDIVLGYKISFAEAPFKIRFYDYANKAYTYLTDGMVIMPEQLYNHEKLVIYMADLEGIRLDGLKFEIDGQEVQLGSFSSGFKAIALTGDLTIRGRIIPSDIYMRFDGSGRFIGSNMEDRLSLSGLTELQKFGEVTAEERVQSILTAAQEQAEGVTLTGWKLTKGAIGTYQSGTVFSPDFSELADTEVTVTENTYAELAFEAVWEDSRENYTVSYEIDGGEGGNVLLKDMGPLPAGGRSYEVLKQEDYISTIDREEGKAEFLLTGSFLTREKIQIFIDGREITNISSLANINNGGTYSGYLGNEYVMPYRVYLGNVNGNVTIKAYSSQERFTEVHYWLDDDGTVITKESISLPAPDSGEIKRVSTVSIGSQWELEYGNWAVPKITVNDGEENMVSDLERGGLFLNVPVAWEEGLTFHVYHTRLHPVMFYNAYKTTEIHGLFGGEWQPNADGSYYYQAFGSNEPIYPVNASYADALAAIDDGGNSFVGKEPSQEWRSIQMERGYRFIGWEIVEIPADAVEKPGGGFYALGDIVQMSDIEAMGPVRGKTYFTIACEKVEEGEKEPDIDPTPTPVTPGGRPGKPKQPGGEGAVAIEDTDVPLSDMPVIEEKTIDIPEQEVPMADLPEIPEAKTEQNPDIPQTGDTSYPVLYSFSALLSLAGIFILRKNMQRNR